MRESLENNLINEAIDKMTIRDKANIIANKRNNPIKKIRVFDFDDTLAKTDSWVYVNKNGKRIAQLDPGEFAVHKLKSGEEYDFSDFDKMLRNPKLIKNNAIEFRKQSDHARRTPGHQVTILTARGIGYPVKHWFKKMGLDVYVVALKSADPKKKADYIEKKIQSGYTDIYFIDDSPKNVRAVKALQVKYPKVKIKQLKHNDNTILESNVEVGYFGFPNCRFGIRR